MKRAAESGMAGDGEFGVLVAQRLPGGALLRVSDVASACNVSADLVRGWVRDGVVRAKNVSSGKRPFYLIARSSVVEFMSSDI